MPGARFLHALQPEVESALADLLPDESADPPQLASAMRYAVLCGGKRIRPALCVATAHAFGGDRAVSVRAGCALEFIHCFSLVHDDLPAIDDDDIRRGRPTLHKEYGEAIALLAGDALFALAFQVASGLSLGPGERAGICGVLACSSGIDGLVGGEVLDVLSEGAEPNKALVENIHRKKTGALIRASCEAGALVSGVTDLGAVGQIGEKLGLAFQIVDDVLNATSDTATLGKKAGTDEAKGKVTYVAAVGASCAQEEAMGHFHEATRLIGELPGDVGPLMEVARACVDRQN